MEKKYPEEGSRILRQREKCRLTQLEVSDRSGVQFGVYQRYEYGIHSLGHARMKTGLAICALLGLDPYEFAFGVSREEYLERMEKARNFRG